MKKHRKNLLNIYANALAAVEGTQAVRTYLTTLLADQTSPLKTNEKVHAIAIGKAAEAMLQGLLKNDELHVIDALLVSKKGHISTHCQNNPAICCIEADHPVPSDASLQAGNALLDYIAKLPTTATCIVLLSGGTSSLVEVLDEAWTLAELQALTQWMLNNALSIDVINTLRSRISLIKGGGLWHYFSPSSLSKQKLFCLLISDVPSDDKRIIGSGLLFPASTEKSAENRTNTQLLRSLPTKWRRKLTKPRPLQAPCFFSSTIIAHNRQAQQAAVSKAQQLGYQVICDMTVLEGDAITIAKQCVKTLRKNRGIVFIWGAETTVHLPAVAGKGGRNQHVALAAAIEMDKHNDIQMLLLAAGTDGTDGTTNDAGGIVDKYTVSQGHDQGLNAIISLKTANANPFLKASNTLITTGVTGTNVMDLIIGYAYE
jgi:hydroxypyruvate reductase